MVTRRLCRAFLLSVSAAALLAPNLAEAQRHGSPRHGAYGPVVVARPSYPGWYYGGWYPWGPYQGPYYPYPVYGFGDDLSTSVRLEVDQREAEVFVDGYRAGVVDDFDGTFQRLRLRPGGHQIVVFLEGYRTIRENVYLSSGTDKRLKIAMDRLEAGERSEPPPQPESLGTRAPDDDPATRGSLGRPEPPRQDREPQPREVPQEAPRPTGTLSLSVQPGDAEIFVNGERWGLGADQERVAIQLPEGRHRIEIRKAGFATYTEDVLIRRGGTLRLDASLKGTP